MHILYSNLTLTQSQDGRGVGHGESSFLGLVTWGAAQWHPGNDLPSCFMWPLCEET